MKKNKKITAAQIAKSIDSSERTAQRYIRELRETGIISRCGSDAEGYWIINELVEWE